jgi:hypothetical protein
VDEVMKCARDEKTATSLKTKQRQQRLKKEQRINLKRQVGVTNIVLRCHTGMSLAV